MNAKNMAKSLNAKMGDWCKHIDDESIVQTIKENAIITGGALVSLLNRETPNDYDVYFKTKESCLAVAGHYAKKWNEAHEGKTPVEIRVSDEGRITAFVRSKGVAEDNEDDGIDDPTEPGEHGESDNAADDKPKYRPRFFSTNAISLSDSIQLVIRFYGSVDEIHSNYDFVHCTCSYDYKDNKVNLPARALEAIINKELYYTGSKYPLCSIIRTRKFISRGWTINAGQYLKMALQLNGFNLLDMNVLADQLTGVDIAYFSAAIDGIQKKQEDDPDFAVDNSYLFEVINRIF